MGVRYTNQAITTEQQIEILQERGLLIDDIEQAIDVLDTISYFRLAGYWKHFEIDHFTHQFREGSCFSDIVKLYSFDKQLRALLFTAIQTIEVSVRTKIIKHFPLVLVHFGLWMKLLHLMTLVLLQIWLSSVRKYRVLMMTS
nr:Abi family protein [Bacteroides stercoris]